MSSKRITISFTSPYPHDVTQEIVDDIESELSAYGIDMDAYQATEVPDEPFTPPTGPGQPRTKGELRRALGGDIQALNDPYVKRLMEALPDE